jgi:hypothetical protein
MKIEYFDLDRVRQALGRVSHDCSVYAYSLGAQPRLIGEVSQLKEDDFLRAGQFRIACSDLQKFLLCDPMNKGLELGALSNNHFSNVLGLIYGKERVYPCKTLGGRMKHLVLSSWDSSKSVGENIMQQAYVSTEVSLQPLKKLKPVCYMCLAICG